MNSDGGILMIGVNDNGDILGLENGMSVFSERKNWDGWVQHLVDLVRKQIEGEYLSNIVTEKITKENKLPR